MAYLMLVRRWPLARAYDHVALRRPQASPNLGFVYELQRWEQHLGLRPVSDARPAHTLATTPAPTQTPSQTPTPGSGLIRGLGQDEHMDSIEPADKPHRRHKKRPGTGLHGCLRRSLTCPPECMSHSPSMDSHSLPHSPLDSPSCSPTHSPLHAPLHPPSHSPTRSPSHSCTDTHTHTHTHTHLPSHTHTLSHPHSPTHAQSPSYPHSPSASPFPSHSTFSAPPRAADTSPTPLGPSPWPIDQSGVSRRSAYGPATTAATASSQDSTGKLACPIVTASPNALIPRRSGPDRFVGPDRPDNQPRLPALTRIPSSSLLSSHRSELPTASSPSPQTPFAEGPRHSITACSVGGGERTLPPARSGPALPPAPRLISPLRQGRARGAGTPPSDHTLVSGTSSAHAPHV